MALRATNAIERLNRSFAATQAIFERPSVARRVVVLLLATHTCLLAYSAYVHSPTLNEPGHLVAGLSYWKFGHFSAYKVNPPLVKLIAALPVLAVGYQEDWSGFNSGVGGRPEFGMGEDFVAANGKRSFLLFMLARWASIPFSWIGGVVSYLWARDLYGRSPGLIACAIWCFEPNILAHSSLITSDAAGAALGLAACYTFWRWLKRPTWAQAAITGVVLGLAELTKTTLILFYPLWPLMWIVYRWPDRHSMVICNWLSEAGMLAVRMLIGLYVLNLGYGFEGSMKPLGEYQFVSDLLTGRKPEDMTVSHNSPYNRFGDSLLAAVRVPLPANYLLGIDLQQKDFEHYGRPSYLRGEWRNHGWWYYYLYAAAIKVPLGLWVLGALVPISALIVRPATLSRRPRVTAPRDFFVLLLPPMAILAIVSSKTGFSEHFRYVLPCLPFLFVWISGLIKKIVDMSIEEQVRSANESPTQSFILAPACVSPVLVWALMSSLWIYPHSLSFFNEFTGGPLNGSEHLLGSNLDWGQDYLYLDDFCRDRASIPLVHSANFLAVDAVLESIRLVTPSAVSLPVEIFPPSTWVAVSAQYRRMNLAGAQAIVDVSDRRNGFYCGYGIYVHQE